MRRGVSKSGKIIRTQCAKMDNDIEPEVCFIHSLKKERFDNFLREERGEEKKAERERVGEGMEGTTHAATQTAKSRWDAWQSEEEQGVGYKGLAFFH